MAAQDNFVQGALSGLDRTFSILDRLDGRKRRQQLEERDDELYAQSQTDRTSALARQKVLQGRQDEQYEMGLEDRQMAQQDAQSNREHMANLRPLELRMEKARLSNQYTQEQLNSLKLSAAKQDQRNQEAAALYRQSIQLMQDGNKEEAYKVAQGLNDYGFNISELTGANADRAKKIVSTMLTDRMDLNSDDAIWLTKQVLTPALVQSGRDPERFEVAPPRDTGHGTFIPMMTDTKTGKQVPATLNASSDNEDVLTEMTQDDLMAAASQWIKTAETMEEMNPATFTSELKGIGANLGAVAKPAGNAATLKAQLDMKKYADEQARRPIDDFVESYAETPGLQAIAMNLANRPDFDPATAPAVIERIAGMADEGEMSVQAAAQQHFNQQETEQLTAQEANSILADNPSIGEEEARSIATKIAKGTWTLAEANKRIKQLGQRAERKAEREDERRLEIHVNNDSRAARSQRKQAVTPDDLSKLGQTLQSQYPELQEQEIQSIVDLVSNNDLDLLEVNRYVADLMK